MLLMRLGMHMLELLVKAVKVPRNILNPRLEPKLIPVLYHIYSFRSSWQVSRVLGALGLQVTSPLEPGLHKALFPPCCLFCSGMLRGASDSVWTVSVFIMIIM